MQDARGSADSYWVHALAQRNEQYKTAVRDMQAAVHKAHGREASIKSDLQEKQALVLNLKVSITAKIRAMVLCIVHYGYP